MKSFLILISFLAEMVALFIAVTSFTEGNYQTATLSFVIAIYLQSQVSYLIISEKIEEILKKTSN